MEMDGHQEELPPLLSEIARKLMGQDVEETHRKHPAFQQPESRDQIIWRYMDFTKFVSMLHHSGLYLARSDLLGDPFEGSITKATKLLRTALASVNNLPDDAFDCLGSFLKWSHQWTFVNCWHMSDSESAAMWQLYSKSNEAIVIRSTFECLEECTKDQCYIGKVNYLDYHSPIDLIGDWDSLSPFVHKHRSFEHERELRILVQKLPKTKRSDGLNARDINAVPEEKGHWIEVDLNKLITEVRVSPSAASWFRDLVINVCQKYRLDVMVKQSNMNADPIY